MAFKKERAQEHARDLVAWNALSVTSKKEELKLWRRVRRRVVEVYEDGGYHAMKVRGARHLTATWAWADKLEHDTAKELQWVPSEMSCMVTRLRQQEADRHVESYKAEEAANSLHVGKPPCTRELLARGCRFTAPRSRRGYY